MQLSFFDDRLVVIDPSASLHEKYFDRLDVERSSALPDSTATLGYLKRPRHIVVCRVQSRRVAAGRDMRRLSVTHRRAEHQAGAGLDHDNEQHLQ